MSIAIRRLTGIAALAALAVAAIAVAGEQAQGLREVNCATLTVFAPENGQTGEDLCRDHGGLAQSDKHGETPALVILVRNQPVGGSDGLHMR
ncbi:antitermination protein [Stappia sp. GBMRC 2046]|uniref:Antitermination protein n=1 Tax=Stappia sediminis TaxID=2692190 RepID=A0A7X3LRH4_9HYPH|nr:antitermination protein [Stappia sediminis]MXN63755.1 antitermination protein [Stappia sediminis]